MSTTLWTSADAAAATKGRAHGSWSVTGLSIDTRTIKPGEMFIALKDVRDGHDFVPQAYAANANAVMIEDVTGLDTSRPALVVDNTQDGLENLARAARDRAATVRIGVTGSVGKTSVKEAIATVCSAAGKTHKSIKSFNNHWGVPLTLAGMPQDAAYGVFEMGMNHAGELSVLTAIVQPNIAVITKIAAAHLAQFDSVAAIALAKAEIIEGVRAGGTVVLNRDDDFYDLLAKAAGDRRIISVGMHAEADIRIGDIQTCREGSCFSLHHAGRLHAGRILIHGEHWVVNAALAVAAGIAAGIDVEDALAALTELRAPSGRGARFEAVLDGKTVTVIDESYNANPESMRAAIAALNLARDSKGRRIAVLGDMRELGATELDLHAGLAAPLETAGFARVITVGECMRSLKGALSRPLRAAWTKDADTAFAALREEVVAGDVILIKGSNSVGLGALVARLRKRENVGD